MNGVNATVLTGSTAAITADPKLLRQHTEDNALLPRRADKREAAV